MIINGIEYEKRPISKSNTKMSGYLLAMLMMYGGISNKNQKTSPTDDIIGEFELIQQKKSNLSRSEREYVVRQFNRYFTPKLIDK